MLPAARLGRSAAVRLAVIALVALFPGACDPTDDPAVIAVAGAESFLNAARLAFEDETAAGAIPGVDTLLVLEVSNRSAPALTVAERIASVPGMVAVVGHANSASSLAASQVYNGARIVQVAPTSTATIYSQAGPFSFRMVAPDDRQGPFLADVLAEAFPEGASVALFFVNDDYGRGLRASVRSALDPDDFEVTVELPHLEEAVSSDDVERWIGALEEVPFDAILWLARPQSLALLLPRLRARWPDVPVYGGDAVSRAMAMTDGGTPWGRVAYTDFLDPDATAGTRDFVLRFRDRFGGDASGPEILVYDAVRIALQGVRSGARTGDDLRLYLASLGRSRPAFAGLAGEVVFEEDGDAQGSYVLRWLGEER